MKDLIQTMLSCESKLSNAANNLTNMGKSLEAMGLVDRIENELQLSKSVAAFAIKEGINNNAPAIQIIKTCRDQIRDGWKELSETLVLDIMTF